MDPASALGTTSAVLAFLSCIGKTISVARQLHNAKETPLEFQRLDKLSAGLHSGFDKLKQALANKNPKDISASELSLLDVLEQCVALEARIRLAAKSVQKQQSAAGSSVADRAKDEVRHWIKVSAASIRIVLKKTEFDDLKHEFDRCTTLLNTHLAAISRTDIIEKLDAFSGQDNNNTTAIQDSIKNYADWSVAQVDLQMAANHNELLRKIESIEKKLASSFEMLQAASHRLILEGIAFPDMDARLGHIEDQGQVEGTFEWLVNDDEIPESQQGALTMSFRQWLSDDSQGIFHIAGKPGSGKSTLMRFLMEHAETRAQLRKWAAEGGHDSEPLVAAVFFWNAGSRSQKSMNGLYRTLLYSILKSCPQDLVPLLFPERLVTLERDLLRISQRGRGEKIPDGQVAAAFRKLIGGTASRLRFCFFIDGADEFSDLNMPQWKLAREIKAWANSNPKNVKICVSSREEEPWLTSFNNYPRLTIQMTTSPDIRTMVCNAIGEHPNFQVFNPEEADWFVDHFVRIAEGVFLWAKLILFDVVAMLDYGRDIEDLQQALESYPSELDGLFDKIMRDKVRNNEEALTILKVMVEVREQDPTIVFFETRNYSFVKDALSGKIRYGGQWPNEGSKKTTDERVEKLVTSLPLLFGGLVATTFDDDIETLGFNHRSIYQYLVANLQQNSHDKAKIRLIFFQCLVAGMREFPNGCGRYHQRDDDDHYFIMDVIHWVAKFDKVSLEGCFPWLEEVEQNLFRLLDVDIPEEDADPNLQLGLEVKQGPCWVFVLSACLDLASYAEWALGSSTCTSRWITTAQAQAATLDYLIYYCSRWTDHQVYRPSQISSSTRIFSLRTPDHSQTINPNAIVSTRSGGHVSIWQYFIIRMTMNVGIFERTEIGYYIWIWSVVGIFLERGAWPGIYISWSVDEARERQALEEDPRNRYRSKDVTPLCLRDITAMFSSTPPRGQSEGVRTEENCEVSPQTLELLKKEMPNGGSLRDIFLLFGPDDRPDILRLLEAEEPVERDGAKQQQLLENPVGDVKPGVNDGSESESGLARGAQWTGGIQFHKSCFLEVCQFMGLKFGFLWVALFGVGLSVLGYVLVFGMEVKGWQ